MRGAHRITTIVASVAVLAMAGACSDGGENDLADSNPNAALAAAPRRTADAGGVKMSFRATLGIGGASIASGDGAYDFEHDRGRFKVSAAPAMNVDMVITADKLYLKQPPNQPSGKTWIAVTEGDLAQAGPNSGLLGQLRGQVDPRAALRNLGSQVTGVRRIGKAKVRGTDTTHLAGTVDLSEEAIAAAPEDARAGLRQARDATGSDGYPIDVWLDREGRVRRVESQVPAGGAAVGAVTTVRLDLYGFGEDAGVVIPDASDVQEGLG